MISNRVTTFAFSLFIGFSTQAQNLILNGSFESPVTSGGQTLTPNFWQTDGFPPSFEAGGAEDGNQYISLGVEASGTSDGVSQAFNITNGGPYSLNWFDFTPEGVGTAPYSIHILDQVSNEVVSTNLDADHGTGEWLAHSIQVNLLSGTYTVHIRGEPPLQHYGAGIDNVSLQPIVSDLISSIQLSVTICWPGLTNQMYQVQYATNLDSTMWSSLGGSIPGSGANCVTDMTSNGISRFYRVVRVP